MQVTAGDDDKLTISIHTNVPGGDSVVRLYVHNHKAIAAIDQKIIAGGEARFIVDENKLPDGISLFTVLTGKQMPVGERLWFRRPASVRMEIHADKEQYKPREKVTLKLNEPDASGIAPQLNASMAVVLQDSLQSTGPSGYPELPVPVLRPQRHNRFPAYYFSDTNPDVKKTTDLLMMTQGWRKLRQTAPYPRTVRNTAGLLVTGRVTDRLLTLPPAASLPGCPVPGQKFRLASAVSNKDGELQWDLGLLYGAHELVVQTG